MKLQFILDQLVQIVCETPEEHRLRNSLGYHGIEFTVVNCSIIIAQDKLPEVLAMLQADAVDGSHIASDLLGKLNNAMQHRIVRVCDDCGDYPCTCSHEDYPLSHDECQMP